MRGRRAAVRALGSSSRVQQCIAIAVAQHLRDGPPGISDMRRLGGQKRFWPQLLVPPHRREVAGLAVRCRPLSCPLWPTSCAQ